VLFEITRLQDRPGDLLDEQLGTPCDFSTICATIASGSALRVCGAANEIDRLATPQMVQSQHRRVAEVRPRRRVNSGR
jgi:hypothetical protein